MKPVFLLLFVGEPSPSEQEGLHLGQSVQGPGGHVLWTSYGQPEDVGRFLHEALASGRVRSAAFLPELPPAHLRWLATEWWGALVADLDLIDLVIGVTRNQWSREQVDEERHVAVLRPSREHPEDRQAAAAVRELEGTAAAYRQALFSATPSAMRVSLSEVRQDSRAWFGDLADPNVGGAIALLTLSGAHQHSDDLVLRNPAALGLVCEYPDDSLAAHRRDGRVQVSAVGTTEQAALGHLATFRIPADVWASELAALRAAEGAMGFVALLELTGLSDPEIVIGEGLVLEQTGLTGAQTLAATHSRSVRVDVGDIVPVALPAWCLNASLRAPGGEPVRPTPLRFVAGGSQQNVWDAQSELLARSRI
ncbi:hypothetical protein [Streptomyces sp. bgisy153]|uniref:hypothetical protein n=1 Tax=Streptomyces sp. bgisy153 TaxID=3413793 RepID=UPI003D71F2CD